MLLMQKAVRSVVVGAMLARERWQSGVVYNPLSRQTVQDPYPVYAALRERDPVHRSGLMNSWLFTRHADIDTILRDHRRFGNDPFKGKLSRRQRANLPAYEELSMLFLDPPDHKRLRALVNKAFTPKAVNALERQRRKLLVGPVGRGRRPRWFRPDADGSSTAARDRYCRDARRAAVGPGAVKVWSDQRARTLEPVMDARDRAASEAAAIALDANFRPVSQARSYGTAGRHRERARAGGRGRRPPHRSRDA